MTSTDLPALPRALQGVLVTDLVASTQLRVTLGDELADRLFQEHDDLVRAAIRRYQGVPVCWRGDGAVAVFESASAAALAAVAIQQATARINARRKQPASLAMRVGVGAGEVVSADEEHCPVVAETAALCASAEGGQILSHEGVLELIGTRAELVTERIRDRVQAICWVPVPRLAERLGMPPGLNTAGQLPFTGRDALMEHLREQIATALNGRTRLTLIRGDAGVGKSRLAAELAREALADGAAVLYGACQEDVSLPFAPAEQALRYWVEHVEDILERVRPSAGELTRLVPKLAARAPGLPPPTVSDTETERARLFEAIGDWLASICVDEPLVLVMDSLHWADEATLELLSCIVEQLQGSPMAIIATFRSEDDRAQQLGRRIAETVGPDAVTSVTLDGLTVEHVRTLTGELMDEDMAARTAVMFHAATRGNPLHLAQLLRQSESAGFERIRLPASIGASLRSTVGRLSDRHRQALEVAAVLGMEFPASYVAQLMADPDAAYDGLDAAQRVGLVRDVDTAALLYRFQHDLIRETLYGGIGAARRARLHERAGVMLEAEGGEDEPTLLASLARHAVAALPLGDKARAVRYCQQAARHALATYANEQAKQLFTTALDLVSREREPRTWCECVIGKGEAMRRLGMKQHRPVLFEAADVARDLGDGTLMGAALVPAFRGTFSRAFAIDTAYVNRLHEALSLLGAEPSPLRARLLALTSVEAAWETDGTMSRRLSDDAVAVARQLGDEHILGEVLACRQWSVYHPLADRLATTEELAALEQRLRDPQLSFQIAGTEAFTRIRAGDGPGYRAAMSRLRQAAEALDQPLVRWMLCIREAAGALMEGRFDEARAFIDEGLALGLRTAQPDCEAQAVIQRYWLAHEIQPAEEARGELREIALKHERIEYRFNLPPIAFRCCELGLTELAGPVLDSYLAGGVDDSSSDQARLFQLCQLATCAACLDRSELCESLLRWLAPHAQEHANIVFASLGSVARYLGLLAGQLGRLDDAERWLARAVDSNRNMGAVTWEARARFDLARVQAHRSPATAAQSVREAGRAARALGLPALVERIDAYGARLDYS